MKHFTILFFLMFLIFDSFGRNKSTEFTSKDTVFLVNKIPHFEFNLSYTDKFGDGTSIDRIKEIRIVSETRYIEVHTLYTNYWLRKGNHYTLYHDGFKPVIETFLEDRIQNNEIMFFAQLFHENPSLSITRSRQQIEIRDNVFRVKSKERYQQKIDYLEKQKTNISPFFYDLCSKFFLMEYLGDLLYLFEKKREEDVKQILLDHREVIYWDDLLFSSSYKQFLLSYVSLLNPNFSDDYSWTKEYFSGKVRDYLLFNMVKNGANIDSLTEFFNDCQDEDYKDYIKQKLMVKEKLLISKDQLLQIDLSQISLEDMLSKYRGKFVYVDIWASWCTPCRKLLSLSHKWQEQFKEDIEFIYISIDESGSRWINAVNNENLDKKNCYLISGQSNLIKEHRIIDGKGIPYYMIFDRNGKLVVGNAMRPDDPNFIDKVNDVLSKY